MLVTGKTVIHRIFKCLETWGFKEGSEITPKDIEKAIQNLGYFDIRTIQKYTRVILESEWVTSQPIFEEIRTTKPDLKPENSWSYQKRMQLYIKKSMRDLSLFSDDELTVEKTEVGKKYFIKRFP